MKSPMELEKINCHYLSTGNWDHKEILDYQDLEQLEKMRTEDQKFIQGHPYQTFRKDLENKRKKIITFLVLSPVLLAAVAAIILLPLPARFVEDTRIKSPARDIFLYMKTPQGSEILDREKPLEKDREVQIAYFTQTECYGAILSVDGRDQVTVHLPLEGQDSVKLQTPAHVILPYSYRLDDAPNYETFFLITSKAPFDINAVKTLLKVKNSPSLTGEDLPAPYEATSFTLTKMETSE